MKVLFLNPSRAGQGNIPLNIPLLIAVLKKGGHLVRLFDLSDYAIFNDASYSEMFFKNAEFDKELVTQDRKGFYKNKCREIVTDCRLKETDYRKDFEKMIIDFKPDIIAVSCLSIDFKFASSLISPFKKRYKLPVIFGGIHAILLPEETLVSDTCDFVCIGEGESCFTDLLYALEHNKALESVHGIWLKKNGEIIKNPHCRLTDLCKLPYPDFEDFDPIHFYRPFDRTRYKMINYELSRGCLFSCSYCVNSTLKEKYKGQGPYHRTKDISQSIEELKFLVKKYNFNFIRFWDEDFSSINCSYLNRYAKAYSKEINLPFLIYARVDTMTEKKIQILKNMGCKGIAMGVESGNELIRKNVMNRKMSNTEIIEKFKLVKSYGIRVSSYNIIGLPHETREYIFDTIRLNREISPDSFSVTLLEPYRGTPIRRMCEEQGLDKNLEPNYNIFNGQPLFIPKSMKPSELRGLFRTFPLYIRFPEYRWDEVKTAEIDDSAYGRLREESMQLKQEGE